MVNPDRHNEVPIRSAMFDGDGSDESAGMISRLGGVNRVWYDFWKGTLRAIGKLDAAVTALEDAPAVIASGGAVVPAWIALPAPQNGWASANVPTYGAQVYSKESTPDKLHLRGQLSGGVITDAIVLCTMPAGYFRADISLVGRIATYSSGSNTWGAAMLFLYTTGDLRLYGAAVGTTHLNLNCQIDLY